MKAYDVIVVGLGHAGCEAALACARMGMSTLGVTLRRDRIAVMSCNPAIGGTAKGHLVRELDALGGEMARAADLTGTHFKTLNASRGPAVRATRVLTDRDAYALAMQQALFAQPNLDIIDGEVSDLLVEDEQICGIGLKSKHEFQGKTVILTTGTFLQALMHFGSRKEIGGRLGDQASTGLSEGLRRLGFQLGRFKTGTPSRLIRNSIDYERCEPQPGDSSPKPFSLKTLGLVEEGAAFPQMPQVLCHIAYTNARTHQIVRENLSRSPLYCGQIVGRGPRYCPSFEDKVVRFSNRDRHQVFLEPEGPQSHLVYPAGLSTSMPEEVQLSFLRSIPGLESVEVARFGYAVEYDYAPPTQLKPTLETRRILGLYFAGQLNGTSGYEEAAFQGLIAGVNAASSVQGRPPFVLDRSEAHGAVLIDELVTRGVDEPFRMFTSRSEHRLRLREGNADLRLRQHARRLGLATDREVERTERRRAAIGREVERLQKLGLAALLRRPGGTYEGLAAGDPDRPALPSDVIDEVEVEIKYEGYIAQHDRALARKVDQWDHWLIPEGLHFKGILGMSREAVDQLGKYKPQTVGQARRIPGLTPSSISLLLIHLRRHAAASSHERFS